MSTDDELRALRSLVGVREQELELAQRRAEGAEKELAAVFAIPGFQELFDALDVFDLAEAVDHLMRERDIARDLRQATTTELQEAWARLARAERHRATQLKVLRGRREQVRWLRAGAQSTINLLNRIEHLEAVLEMAREALVGAAELAKDGRRHYPGCIGLYGYPCKAWCTAEEDIAAIDAELPRKEGES